MQEFIGSVRRSLVFKPTGEESAGFGGLVEKIGSSIRKSRVGLFSKPPVHALPPIGTPSRKNLKAVDDSLPPMEESTGDDPPAVGNGNNMNLMKAEPSKKKEVASSQPPIRWRKGELIGCGAFGRVHMGMNIDSGELLAVKEVAIAANSASKKTQDYIRELEQEVNLLKNLSHPNIVRYLGTAREEVSLNILLEFVPGGSISSLLEKFGSFPESVIRTYTKQLLIGLEYLHKNKIMHRDIKGANILVDNKGCIKLADFGASKKVEALFTITGAKSMKGTPYWMAPEVIVQSGHSYSADIWSVGCTVIEMATGKPPWSQQYQEVAALFYVGTTKSHPPIPDHLSIEAKDFLLKCLQKEPDVRPTASELLKHPFVTHEGRGVNLGPRSSLVGSSGKQMAAVDAIHSVHFAEHGSLYELTNNHDDDDMCRIDDNDDLVIGVPTRFRDNLLHRDANQSFNPMCEPNDGWPCKFDESPTMTENYTGFTFPTAQSGPEEDDEVTESKITAFLDEKALELKKLQSPLYQFYNSLNVASPPSPFATGNKENVMSNFNLPPKSKSPNRSGCRRFSTAFDVDYSSSPKSFSRRVSNIGDVHSQASKDVKELLLDSQGEPLTRSSRFFEIQRKWKEELDEELQRTRELMRQASTAKAVSPKDRTLNRYRDPLKFASPGK